MMTMTMMMMMMMVMMTIMMMISANIRVMTRTKMIVRVKTMGNQVEEEGMVEGAMAEDVAKVARVEGGNNLKNQRRMRPMTMMMVMMMMMGTKTVLHGQCSRTSHQSQRKENRKCYVAPVVVGSQIFLTVCIFWNLYSKRFLVLY